MSTSAAPTPQPRNCAPIWPIWKISASRRAMPANGAPGASLPPRRPPRSVMLTDFPEVRHVYLASGSCLPLRPVDELRDYLNDRPRTDFIESVTTADVGWTIGGLNFERFTLRFPFSWRKHRLLFDTYVELQRRSACPPQDAGRHRAASGQPMVVPDPPDPVRHPGRTRARRNTTATSARSGSRTKAISRRWCDRCRPTSKAAS